MADLPGAEKPDGEDLVDAIPSTSTYEDDETASRAEVDPDPDAGGEPEGEDRPVAWRAGRRGAGTSDG